MTILNTVGDLRTLLDDVSDDTPLSVSYTGEGRLAFVWTETENGEHLCLHEASEAWLIANCDGVLVNPLVAALYD